MPTVFCTPLIRKGLYDGRSMYFVQQESCFWSCELWNKVGGIDKQYKLAGDYVLWKKFAQLTELYTIHCNLSAFRIHDGQKSKDIDSYYGEIMCKERGDIIKILIKLYTQLYSIINYRKYVINIDNIFEERA